MVSYLHQLTNTSLPLSHAWRTSTNAAKLQQRDQRAFPLIQECLLLILWILVLPRTLLAAASGELSQVQPHCIRADAYCVTSRDERIVTAPANMSFNSHGVVDPTIH